MSNQYRLFLHANGYFYHRVKVPSDIRRLYGKQIEQRSLRTRDYREALRRLPAVIVEVDNDFAQVRTAQRCGAITGTSPVASHGSEYCPSKPALRDFGTAIEAREVMRGRAPLCLASDDLDRFLRQTWEWIAERHASGLTSVARSSLITACTDYEPKVLEDRPEELRVEQTSNVTGKRHLFSAAPGDLPLMSVIAGECFESVVREKKWSPKTTAARQTQIKQFVDICGDKPLNRYTQDDIRYLKNTLFATPPRSGGRREFIGFSKVQIAEQAKSLGAPGLSTETVRQVMTAANIVFGWSRTEYDHKLQNIVQPMIPSPSSGGSKRDKRHGFNSEELGMLFKSPLFTGVKSEVHWYEPGEIPMQSHGRFWVPLNSPEFRRHPRVTFSAVFRTRRVTASRS